MTPTELWLLIQSDPQAKAFADAGNDRDCAARCSEIAPAIRQPVPADRVQEVASLNGAWGTIKIAATNSALTDPPRGACIAFVDWIESARPINFDNPAVQQMAGIMVSYSLLTAGQVAELSALADSPQIITADQVSEAAFPHRYPTTEVV
jgi:hypothetical protein